MEHKEARVLSTNSDVFNFFRLHNEPQRDLRAICAFILFEKENWQITAVKAVSIFICQFYFDICCNSIVDAIADEKKTTFICFGWYMNTKR